MYHHTAILAKDLNTSREFYERLGMAVLREWEKPNEQLAGVVMQHPDGMILELIHHPEFNRIVMPGLPELLHIGFSVASIPETLVKLEDVEVIRPLTPGVSVKEFCFVRDPSGFPVELVVEK